MRAPQRLSYARTGNPGTDRALAFVQDATRGALASITDGTILDGVLLESVAIVTTGTAIDHTLGRQPRGWKVVDVDAAATIYRSAWSETTLTLVPSADCTVSLWVF
jgi:hypothetical protein